MIALICNIILIVNMPHFLGMMRMFSPLLLSSSTSIRLASTIIAVAIILLATNLTIGNAQQQQQQQQQQLMSQASAIENGTALSIEDSFRVHVPEDWVIHDVRNTGFTLGVEVLQGYGLLAQLCPEEHQQRQQSVINNASGANISTGGNSCQGAQGEIIHIVRYPNLGTRLGISSDDIIGNDNVTADVILGYQMEKLQEAGYRDIRIVNSTDTTINVDLSAGLNNNTMTAKVPAKLVEMTYSTNLAPNETRRGYFVSTATNATPPNLGTIKGYAVFYESNSTTSTSATAAEITTTIGRLLPSAKAR
jgi:hypothetical protein